MTNLKPYFLHLVLAAAASIIIGYLAPGIHSESAIYLPLDSEQIIDRSKQILDALQVDVGGYAPEASLRQNKLLVRQVEQQFGLGGGIPLLRSNIPGYFWEVKWRKKKPLTFFGGGQQNDQEPEAVLAAIRGDVFFKLSTAGNLLELERRIPDSVMIPSISPVEARTLADGFLRQYSFFDQLKTDTAAVSRSQEKSGVHVGVSTQSERRVEQPRRVDFEYSWSTESPELKDKILVKVSVAGNLVSRYSVEYQVPPQYAETGAASFHQVGVILIYIAMTIVLIVVGVKRIRAYEIGFRLAVILGAVAGLAIGFKLYVMIIAEAPGWEILIPLVFGILFVGGGLLLCWAVGEAIGRDAWKDKFVSIDLLTNGYVVHSRVGSSLVVGVAIGAVAFALWLVLARAAESFLQLWMYESEEGYVRMFGAFSPSLYVLTDSFLENIFSFTLFILFCVSYLKKRIASPAVLLIAGGLIAGLLNDRSIQPLPVGMLLNASVGALLVWTLYRYDVLAALAGMISMSIVKYGTTMMTAGHETYAGVGYGLFILLGVIAIVSLGSLYRKREIREFEKITPAFARQITERQRLQQELEIARHVQMSFLPKENPVIPGLQIASRCVPALEVGGDYFDFVTLGKKKLAVAVGDVSGKGTQAAFYMTLAKGFLRALSDLSGSVSEVLTQINKLFYENVERGAFISMVYGVFDIQKKRLTLTRAGHNPVLVWKAKGRNLEVIQPNGLALGLEEGKKFSRTIQEVIIPFRPGDGFVFYTDGFTEARNGKREEFGEERFLETVRSVMDRPAGEAMEGIFEAMRNYAGKAKQHDDMTIVVVKIVGNKS